MAVDRSWLCWKPSMFSLRKWNSSEDRSRASSSAWDFFFAADWIFPDDSCRIKVKDAVHDVFEDQNVFPGVFDLPLPLELLVKGVDGVVAFLKGFEVHAGHPGSRGSWAGRDGPSPGPR